MADFAYAYSSVELEKLDVPSLEEVFENVRTLLARKRAAQGEPTVDEAEVERINAVYDKIPADEQRVAAASDWTASVPSEFCGGRTRGQPAVHRVC